MLVVYSDPKSPVNVYRLVEDEAALQELYSSLPLPAQASLKVTTPPDDMAEDEYLLFQREQLAIETASGVVQAKSVFDVGAGTWPAADTWQSSVLYDDIHGRGVARAAVLITFEPASTSIKETSWKQTCGSVPALSVN